jgi:putative tricarboxylic transport membrane protein
MFDLIGNLGLGFATALSPLDLGLCFIGALVGTLIGVLPCSGTSKKCRSSYSSNE